MTDAIRRRLSYANLMATIAVFVALGGSGYAAVKVNGKNIKNRSVAGKKLKKNTVGGSEINESRLGKVRVSAGAERALTANTANTADRANTAVTARSAESAASVGGMASRTYFAEVPRPSGLTASTTTLLAQNGLTVTLRCGFENFGQGDLIATTSVPDSLFSSGETGGSTANGESTRDFDPGESVFFGNAAADGTFHYRTPTGKFVSGSFATFGFTCQLLGAKAFAVANFN